MAQFGYPLTVPPLDPGEARDHWQTMGASLLESGHAGPMHPAVTNFAAMATAYRQQKPDSFNRRRGRLPAWLTPQFENASSRKAGPSSTYNRRQALPPRDDHLPLRVRPGVRRAADLHGRAQPLGIAAPLGVLPGDPGRAGPHLRPGLPHGAGRPPARDQPLLLGHLHWLGDHGARAGAGADLPGRHRQRGRLAGRLRHADDRP